MGSIIYKQCTSFLAGKAPDNPNVTKPTEKDFEVDPAETYVSSDFNENVSVRYSIPASTPSYALNMGTVSIGKVLVIKPDADIEISITNTNGTSQYLKITMGKWSVLHLSEFTQITIRNNSTASISGKYFIAGD